MRLTLLSRDFPPAVGGIGDHTDLLSAELASRGHTVTVLCSPPAERRASVDVRPVAERWDRRGHRAIARAVSATKPDAIVWQYNPFAAGRRGLAPSIGRLARALAAEAPLVLLAHELWFPWGREGLKGLAWAISHRVQARALTRAASAVVVTTERRAAELARVLPTVAAKASVIPIGANVEPVPAAPEHDSRQILRIPASAFVVAHFGSVGPGRELGPVLGAIATLRARGLDARLLLAGKAGPFQVPASLEGAVTTTGLLPRDEVSRALACADAYVHPDLAGPAAGRRGSLMAALAHGLPVVAYRGPDHAPQLVDGRNVVLCAAEREDVARALESLARDRDAARRIGDEARRTYDESFSWPRVAAMLEDVLREAAR